MKKNYTKFQRSTNIMGKIKKEDLESMKEVEEPKEQDMNPKDPTKKLKPLKAVLGVLALGAVGAKAFDKFKKKDIATPGMMGVGASMGVKKKLANMYEKKTEQKTAKMNSGGEVEVMKGGDYIKDLIS